MRKNTQIKKLAAVMLAAAVAAGSLTACGDSQAKKDTQSTGVQPGTEDTANNQGAAGTEDSTEPESQADADSRTDAAITELAELLAQIASTVEAGTAGASLKAVPAALSLLDWGSGCEPGADAVQDCVKQYLAGLDEGAQEEFRMQLTLVCSVCREIAGENGSALIEDAGCEAPNYPYDASSLTELDALEAAVTES